MTSVPSRKIGVGGELDFSFKGGALKGRRPFDFFAGHGRAAVELAAEALDRVLGPHPMDAPCAQILFIDPPCLQRLDQGDSLRRHRRTVAGSGRSSSSF